MKKVLLSLCIFGFLFANEKTDDQKVEKEAFKQTHHVIVIDGKELNYTVTCGTLNVKNENKKSTAKIFYISYSKNDDSKARPISFVFNGGPGSSSVWLNIGALGPKRILSWEENQTCLPPYNLVDNQETILDFTDLVFVDPVGTGFSDIIEGNADDFYGIKEDTKAVGDFIYKYIAKFNKWTSPKYMIGESYGSMRVIWTTEYLQDYYNVFFNGISLISPVLDTSFFPPFSNMGYALILPTYTATARYHHLLPLDLQNKSLQEVIAEAENFASNEYILALIQGDLLTNDQKEKVISKLSDLTGLTKECVEENNLRIDADTFIIKLLPKDKNTNMLPILGIHDSRTKGYKSERFYENPSLDLISGSYGAVINDYIRNDLQYTNENPYILLNLEANGKWKWFEKKSDPKEEDLSYDIKHIFATNPNIKILFIGGYFDLATPYNFNKFAVNHLNLPKSFKEKIQFEYYEAGHMPYLNRSSHKKMKEDLTNFFIGKKI